ncbi:hypothetical protein [Nocardia sp. NPDC020380]|uniref:hypothetical protein n=1 Tax=Nocardia sp. NPDC020380 TaxID=3364309 RepID=UPI00379B595B
MASKRPVNRVTPQRRPAAQRGSASRTTAADVRGGETARGTSPAGARTAGSRPGKTAQRGPAAPKYPAAQSKPKSAGPGGFWRTWGVAVGCGIATVLLAALAIVGYLRPGVDDGNKAYVDNKSTEEVKAAADNALSTLYGYSAKDLDKDKWKAAVAGVLTDSMRQDFDKYIDTTYDAVKQAQTDTKVTTDPVGVTLLTDDHAELLVNLNVAAVQNGKPEPLASGPIVVRLQKVNGHWLTSAITDK